MTAVGSILSVLFVAIGLYITNEANREQQRLTAQGQITDRFTKAVEQLGQPGMEKLDVRLGAIYALERIMRDSTVDQAAVIDILAAFVRIHAPIERATALPTKPPVLDSPTVDIQAALTVLGRRDVTRDGSSLDGLTARITTPDLTETDLAGVNLSLANLARANLTGANLTSANLSYANLTDTHLRFADLDHVDLSNANLAGANLTGANLTAANLTRANLTGANLAGAKLSGAGLFDANLNHADLTGADLTQAHLTCARTDERTIFPADVPRPAQC
ncbi:pentapeptide repeat-containing protein [Micromonospora sp. NPDC005172]|uniref:pentapeptide repeat-containing protein n=1 Tax=Micromonospora sp. NPDC005172 TaxID=3156867 RepID=UPI0033AA5C56